MRNFSILMFWCFATACGNTDSDEVSPAPGTNNTNNVTVGTSNNSTTVQNNSSNLYRPDVTGCYEAQEADLMQIEAELERLSEKYLP